MKLRCFFGPSHGRWLDVVTSDMRDGWKSQHTGYVVRRMAKLDEDNASDPETWWYALIAEGHTQGDAYDWLFTFDRIHPQHTYDPRHPRQIAGQSRQAAEGRDDSTG